MVNKTPTTMLETGSPIPSTSLVLRIAGSSSLAVASVMPIYLGWGRLWDSRSRCSRLASAFRSAAESTFRYCSSARRTAGVACSTVAAAVGGVGCPGDEPAPFQLVDEPHDLALVGVEPVRDLLLG
jgi:hypothetical protein